MISIALLNRSTVVPDSEVVLVADALDEQAKEFSRAWGGDGAVVVSVYGPTTPAPLGTWNLVILDESDQAGALGYHDLTPDGLPLGKIFAGTDKRYGAAWSVTASHELVEMLGDPDINLAAFDRDGLLWALETGDACEADEFGYAASNGVLLSDYLLPDYFRYGWSSVDPAVGRPRFDREGHISAPFEILRGGYSSVLTVGSNDGWRQINGPLLPGAHASRHAARKVDRVRSRPPVGSRRERRRVGREAWLRSNR